MHRQIKEANPAHIWNLRLTPMPRGLLSQVSALLPPHEAQSGWAAASSERLWESTRSPAFRTLACSFCLDSPSHAHPCRIDNDNPSLTPVLIFPLPPPELSHQPLTRHEGLHKHSNEQRTQEESTETGIHVQFYNWDMQMVLPNREMLTVLSERFTDGLKKQTRLELVSKDVSLLPRAGEKKTERVF